MACKWTAEQREAARERARNQQRWPPTGHCICGLPVVAGGRCSLCIQEGCHGFDDDGPDAWDGKTYPSRRRHRVGTTPDENPEAWSVFLNWWFMLWPSRQQLDHRPPSADGKQPVPRTWLDDLLDGEEAA